MDGAVVRTDDGVFAEVVLGCFVGGRLTVFFGFGLLFVFITGVFFFVVGAAAWEALHAERTTEALSTAAVASARIRRERGVFNIRVSEQIDGPLKHVAYL